MQERASLGAQALPKFLLASRFSCRIGQSKSGPSQSQEVEKQTCGRSYETTPRVQVHRGKVFVVIFIGYPAWPSRDQIVTLLALGTHGVS